MSTKTAEEGNDVISDLDDSSDDEGSWPVDPNDDGEVIQIDYMKKGYSFSKFIDTVTSDDKWIDVGEDYIPTSGDVRESFVVARCDYLGLELTQENKDITKGVMSSHQNLLRNLLKGWIQRFWVELSKPLGITYTDAHRREGRPVVTFADFQCAVRQLKTREEAKKIAICMYVVFDFFDNFRKRISRPALKQYGLRLVPSEAPVGPVMGNDPTDHTIKYRRKKNCFERLATQMLTDQRKNINRISLASCGYTFTKTRPNGVITDANEKIFRRKKCFYPWMVMGDYVRQHLW